MSAMLCAPRRSPACAAGPPASAASPPAVARAPPLREPDYRGRRQKVARRTAQTEVLDKVVSTATLAASVHWELTILLPMCCVRSSKSAANDGSGTPGIGVFCGSTVVIGVIAFVVWTTLRA
jgi:hypothetical protein